MSCSASVLSMRPASATTHIPPVRDSTIFRELLPIDSPLGRRAAGVLLCQCDVVLAVAASLFDAVDELPGHMKSDAAGPRFAPLGHERRRWHAQRVECLAVIDDLDFDGTATYSQANRQLVRATLGPGILDDIADDLV